MTCVVLAMPGAMAAANMPTNGDVGNYGVWATDHNKSLFVNSLTTDIESFQKPFQENVLVKDYVPIEAKVGRAFIGAMSVVGEVLERSLVRFVSIFIIVMFIFWIMLEAYHMMRATQKSRELLETILKAAIWIFVWIWIIEQGPAQLFMWIMGPVISIGTYLSDLILESVVTASGASLPDTCAAIHKYVVSTQTGTTLVDSVQTADLLCVPTRLSGFFYTAVAAGWKWMLAGIGQSVFTFVAGATFVVIFIYNIWKFALMALGVIADLFLVILMLPFTAISETFGKMKLSNSKGYPEQILEGFMGIFQTQSLSSQIQKFISAVIYFISLSIVIAVCAAILSGVIDSNLAATIPTLENEGFMITLIVGCLVAYLANKAGQIATDFGGAVGNGLPNLESDIQKVWSNTSETAKSWWKILRKKT
jgi:hypothetical protein